jgi:hypothetical protein
LNAIREFTGVLGSAVWATTARSGVQFGGPVTVGGEQRGNARMQVVFPASVRRSVSKYPCPMQKLETETESLEEVRPHRIKAVKVTIRIATNLPENLKHRRDTVELNTQNSTCPSVWRLTKSSPSLTCT